MATLEKIKKDGSETGATSADKINLAIDRVNEVGAVVPSSDVIDLVMGVGKTASINIIDGDTDKPMAQVRYIENGSIGSELVLETRDANNDLLSLIILGANGHVINPTSGETITSEHDLVTAKMLSEPFRLKADVLYVDSSVINEYSGVVPPLAQTGKSNDVFHQYPNEVDTTIQGGVAMHDYSLSYFPLFEDSSGQNGVTDIAITPSAREISILFAVGRKPQTDRYVLNINGTDVPLTVLYNTASGYIGYYSSGFDATIQGINFAMPFTLRGFITNGVKTDWVKSAGTWYVRPIFNATYDYIKTGIPDGGNPITIKTTAYANIAELVTPIRDAGVYSITFSITFDYNSTNKSAYFQWSIDSGTTWEEFRVEPKDATDKKALHYEFPHEHTGGSFNLKLMGKCENSSNTLSVDYANIVIERKK